MRTSFLYNSETQRSSSGTCNLGVYRQMKGLCQRPSSANFVHTMLAMTSVM